jgi:membrane-bound serine protease (ClpP class)
LGLVALAAGAVLLSFGNNAAAETASDLAPVDIVAVSGLIDEVVVASIENAIERSESNGAQALVLQLNSRGAVVSHERMAGLLEKIADARIPVAVWVGPSSARAFGLSAQLLTVADVRAMAPGALIGFTGPALQVNGAETSFGDSSAILRTSSIEFSEARKEGILNYAGDDEGVPVVRNMLLALDGINVGGTELNTVIEKVDETGQIVRDATAARFYKLELTDQLMHTVASPPVAYLLFAIGLSLLIFEFFTAGIGIAGVVGAVCSMLGIYGLAALPIRGWAVALLVMAIVAFAVDVQVGVPRFWTGVGLTAFVVASFALYQPIDGTNMRMSWITLVSGIGMMALAFIVGMPSMVRTRFATPTIGREWLIGAEGIAVSDVNPEGIVTVQNGQWRARTNRSTPITTGSPFRVAAIDGITLEIEPLEGAARDYREKRSGASE